MLAAITLACLSKPGAIRSPLSTKYPESVSSDRPHNRWCWSTSTGRAPTHPTLVLHTKHSVRDARRRRDNCFATLHPQLLASKPGSLLWQVALGRFESTIDRHNNRALPLSPWETQRCILRLLQPLPPHSDVLILQGKRWCAL